MQRSRWLPGVLVLVASGLCWWPLAIEPNLGWIAPWLPPALVASAVACVTLISPDGWWEHILLAVIGSAIGQVSGVRIWPIRDGIEASYAAYAIVAEITCAGLLSWLAGYTAHRAEPLVKLRRAIAWAGLLGCVGFGPIMVAATPPLVALRIRLHDVAARQRFTALKQAVELTRRRQEDICDGQALERNYSGPPFRRDDWRYLAGNYVREDGHLFMLYCHEAHGGYTIDVEPDVTAWQSRQPFCSDETGKAGCRMEWDRTRHACLPCKLTP